MVVQTYGPSTGEPSHRAQLRHRASRALSLTVAVVMALVVSALVVALGSGGALEVLPGRLAVAVEPGDGVDVLQLQPAVRRATERALAEARAEGVELRVTSGWRSAEHQQQLYEEALATYGSDAAARQWVLPPQESEHVRGGAVDVGPAAGAAWLDVHGVRFGLCRRYDNEPWHFELLASAKGSACPAREPHP